MINCKQNIKDIFTILKIYQPIEQIKIRHHTNNRRWTRCKYMFDGNRKNTDSESGEMSCINLFLLCYQWFSQVCTSFENHGEYNEFQYQHYKDNHTRDGAQNQWSVIVNIPYQEKRFPDNSIPDPSSLFVVIVACAWVSKYDRFNPF